MRLTARSGGQDVAVPPSSHTRTLVVLGGTGDLTGRLLLPGLAELVGADEAEHLGGVIAVGRNEQSDDEYRDWARERLEEHAGDVPEKAREKLVAALRYRQGDVSSPDDLRAVLDHAGDAPVVYLALPNTVFRPTLEALEQVPLPDGALVAVEKPFGEDGDDARALNEILHRMLPEERIFRVDHFMAMRTVLNVLGLRFANRLFEPVWNAGHVDRVDIVFD